MATHKEFHAMTAVLNAVNEIAANINDAGVPHAIASFNELLFQLSRRDVVVGNAASSCTPSQPSVPSLPAQQSAAEDLIKFGKYLYELGTPDRGN